MNTSMVETWISKTVRAAAVLLLSGFPAGAQPRKDLDCTSSNNSAVDLAWCARLEFDRAESALDALVQEMLKKYDAENRAVLTKAQSTWTAYRDAECKYETNLAEGNYGALAYHQCRTALTKERLQLLNGQYHCVDGSFQGRTCNPPN
jgi:uncharacterized protein YecT (DUF1311 family)